MKNDIDKTTQRKALLAQRLAMPDRQERSSMLQSVLRVWLVDRQDTIIGAYWPIRGEFDPLPALYRWQEAAPDNVERKIGLPVIDRSSKQLSFHAWYPGCPMEEDAYGIPKPKNTLVLSPTLLLIPCVGYSDQGLRLGYGGGFYDRTLASLEPRPFAVGLAYSSSYAWGIPLEPHDIQLDAILTDEGAAWPTLIKQRTEDPRSNL